MSEVQRVLITPDATIRDAVERIDRGALQVAVVANADGRLAGIVTDGDVRRGLLAGLGLDAVVTEIMNRTPVTAPVGTSRDELLRLMRERAIHQIPLVDADNAVVSISVLDELLDEPERPNHVVLLAGGRGTRLMPLTEDVPKPLLHIGDRPMLQRLVESCRDHGFRTVHLAVNYKAEMIRAHFGDGSEFGVRIDYLTEAEPRGTAGCLSLLAERPTEPIIVMNGDLVTTVNLPQLLEFHREHRAAATMCVREHHQVVPFGVVDLDGHRLQRLEEKPIRRDFVNAGIYVLEPRIVDRVPTTGVCDMTDVLQSLCDDGENVSVFPIREYWLDVGRHPDLAKARHEAADPDA